MEHYLGDFVEGCEGGNTHGQTTDVFDILNVLNYTPFDQEDKQSSEYIAHAHSREVSTSMGQLGAFGSQATKTSIPNQSNAAFNDVIYDESKIFSSDQMKPLTSSDTSQYTVERKRLKDKAYRERLKKGKIEMEYNMETLTSENVQLKNENGNLKSENTHMNKVLQSQAKEIDQLKNDLDRLKHEYKKQNALVQTLSDILASSDLREEHRKLQNENDLLRRSMGMDGQRLQLIEENVKLKHENRVLKVQVDALCEKLITENSRNHEQVRADMI
ncbi:hypothetical protein SLEP1_g34156 [Rubroshorea leprosula]|uniref:Uncharacterized protein n=1 Tax=Rubroshorea leprosula TaxID=152421 RepID=A0AAV5KIW2_9ROSI|nr:hypothetical protein SLEP1_g34156 [Rubroshorea leprosula]